MITFFDNSNGSTNYAENIKNGTLIQVNEGNVEYNSKNKDLKARINELRKNNLFYWDITENLIDNFTEIYVKIVEKSPDMQEFLSEQKETKRFIAQLNTVLKLTDNKVLHNKKFFDYFENPY